MPATPRAEAPPDTYRVKTSLRPDIYELLTLFSHEELRHRAEILDFPFTTLLIPYNIRKYCALFGTGDYRDYLRSSYADKQILLSQVLQSTGISRAAADAASIARHEFVPQRRRRLAYLNASTGVLGDTNISAPAVVGYMLDATSHWSGGTTVEIGVGTGFHAIAMARLHPGLAIIGIERNEGVLRQLKKNISDSGLSERISVTTPGQEQDLLKRAQQIYLTAAASQAQLEGLVQQGGADTDWLLPRQLNKREFADEPDTSWLRTRFGSYAGYLTDEHWNSYCAIEGFRVDPGREQRQRSIIYDTTFVKLLGTIH